MKIATHAPEPWTTVRDNHILVTLPLSGTCSLRVIWSEVDGIDVAYAVPTDGDNGNANARRITACVNACRGIPTNLLEQVESLYDAAKLQVRDSEAEVAQ